MRKLIYFFVTKNGVWGYYDKTLGRLVEGDDIQWDESSAIIDGYAVPMSLYYKWHVKFFEPIVFNEWDNRLKKEVPRESQEAILLFPDMSNKLLEVAMEGKDRDAWYKLQFKTQKKRGGGEMVFIDKVLSAQ